MICGRLRTNLSVSCTALLAAAALWMQAVSGWADVASHHTSPRFEIIETTQRDKPIDEYAIVCPYLSHTLVFRTIDRPEPLLRPRIAVVLSCVDAQGRFIALLESYGRLSLEVFDATSCKRLTVDADPKLTALKYESFTTFDGKAPKISFEVMTTKVVLRIDEGPQVLRFKITQASDGSQIVVREEH